MLRSHDVTALETTAAAQIPASMSEMPPELISAAPSHLDLMLAGVLTCFNEMKLPSAQRAGPPRLARIAVSQTDGPALRQKH